MMSCNLLTVLNYTFSSAEVKEPHSASRRRCCPTLPLSPKLLCGSARRSLPAWFLCAAIGWHTRSRDPVQFEMYSREFQRRLPRFLSRWFAVVCMKAAIQIISLCVMCKYHKRQFEELHSKKIHQIQSKNKTKAKNPYTS